MHDQNFVGKDLIHFLDQFWFYSASSLYFHTAGRLGFSLALAIVLSCALGLFLIGLVVLAACTIPTALKRRRRRKKRSSETEDRVGEPSASTPLLGMVSDNEDTPTTPSQSDAAATPTTPKSPPTQPRPMVLVSPTGQSRPVLHEAMPNIPPISLPDDAPPPAPRVAYYVLQEPNQGSGYAPDAPEESLPLYVAPPPGVTTADQYPPQEEFSVSGSSSLTSDSGEEEVKEEGEEEGEEGIQDLLERKRSSLQKQSSFHEDSPIGNSDTMAETQPTSGRDEERGVERGGVKGVTPPPLASAEGAVDVVLSFEETS